MARDITRFATGTDRDAPRGTDEPDPRALLRALWRRKWVVLGTLTLVTAGGIAFALSETPLYRAESLVRIQSSASTVIELPEIGGVFEADDSTIESEIELLKSRAFAARLVDQLALVEDPEFNTALDPARRPFWKSAAWRDHLPGPVRRYLFGDEVSGGAVNEGDGASARTRLTGSVRASSGAGIASTSSGTAR